MRRFATLVPSVGSGQSRVPTVASCLPQSYGSPMVANDRSGAMRIPVSPPFSMTPMPVTASVVPSHQTRRGVCLVSTPCSKPIQIGPLPMATAVPVATPVALTPAKKRSQSAAAGRLSIKGKTAMRQMFERCRWFPKGLRRQVPWWFQSTWDSSCLHDMAD